MTYRERRLAKAQRLREWAEKRNQRADAVLNSNPELRSCHAFNTQPGHIPARAAMIAADDRAYRSMQKADRMEARADGIEVQAAGAIYSDDPDAPERLTEKIAALEAERDHNKAVNTAIRAYRRKNITAGPETILAGLVEQGTLDSKEAMRLARSFAISPCNGLGYPSFHQTNLGANIRRQKERLAEIDRAKVEGPRWYYYPASKYPGMCLSCEQAIDKGETIVYRKGTGEAKHFACHQKDHEQKAVQA